MATVRNEQELLTFGAGGSPDADTPLIGSSLVLGAQTPPQLETVVGTAISITGVPQVIATVNVPIDKVTALDIYVTGSLILATPGCLLPIMVDTAIGVANFGNSGAQGILLNIDTLRTIKPAPVTFTLNEVGNNLTVSVSLAAIPAFVSGNTYTGSLFNTPPNAIINNASIVTNVGNMYVCATGATDADSAGPTGTGPGPINVGGIVWYYAGPAGTPITSTCTTCVANQRTG